MSAVRAIPFVILLILLAAAIYVLSGAKTLDHSKYPWVLEEQVRRSFRWHFVGRYASKDDCHKAGHSRKIATGKHFRCRFDPGY